MHDAVRISLRRPDVVVDRLRKRLARGVEFEDGDDLARLRLLDQVVIVEAPVGGGIGAKAFSGMAGVTGWPWPHVENAHFEYVTRLGVFDRDRPSQQMHADAFAGAADERTFGRPRTATRHRLVL